MLGIRSRRHLNDFHVLTLEQLLTVLRVKSLIRWGLMAMLLYCSSVDAAEIKFVVEERGRVVEQVAQVTAASIFIKSVGGDQQRDLLFDVSSQSLFVIEHRDRSYLQIDNQTIDEVSALIDSVSGVVESQQGVLSDLLSTFGLSEEPELPVAELRDSGKQLSIGGYSCQLHQAHLEGELNFELCVANNQALNLRTEEYSALQEFFVFSNRLQNKAGKLLSVLGLNLPKMNLSETDGLPIGMHSPLQGLKVRISAIDSDLTPTPRSIPSGYSRSEIPLISGQS